MVGNEHPEAQQTKPQGAIGAQRWFFDGWSRFYDAPLVQWATYWPIHDAIVRELRRLDCRRILDVGCGTGQLADRIVRELPGREVTGCDYSRGMLEHARSRSRTVRWVQADAGHLPLASEAFDAIVSSEAFHWFPDQDLALAELRRVLVAGGRLMLALVSSPASIVSHALRAGSGLLGEPFYWPTSRELRDRLEHAGFEVLAQERIARLPGGILFPPVLTLAERPRAGATSKR